ncbi:MAG: rRNA methyltransferase [Chloroflexi bacterium]|nr:MAG: rRNA methyltransferase [Chloroflexota bacterium]
MKPKIVRVYSENATFQQFETLRRNREKRHRQREFVVEGVRQINLALEYGWTIKGWLYCPERRLSSWATGILERHAAATHYELSGSLLEKLSGKEESSELLALVAMPPDDLERVPLRPDLLVVVFDRPASPGNLGTLIRSSDALGVHGLIITGHAVDLYDPETISASVGSLFALPAIRLASPRELEPWFAHVQDEIGPIQIIGASAKADRPLTEQEWTRPTVLVIGNETTGLSTHYRERCDAIVNIPMGGSATSLNVACAASILLYEIARQRATDS